MPFQIYIPLLNEVSFELSLHHIIFLAILICQPKGGQDVLCFCALAVDEGIYLALITFSSETVAWQILKAADPLWPLVLLAKGNFLAMLFGR